MDILKMSNFILAEIKFVKHFSEICFVTLMLYFYENRI
jgi:hypothetical protein